MEEHDRVSIDKYILHTFIGGFRGFLEFESKRYVDFHHLHLRNPRLDMMN